MAAGSVNRQAYSEKQISRQLASLCTAHLLSGTTAQPLQPAYQPLTNTMVPPYNNAAYLPHSQCFTVRTFLDLSPPPSVCD